MFGMFDELKITMTILKYEVLEQKKKKKDWTDFRSLIMKNPLKKRLESLQKAQVYLEPMRASMMELFCEYT